MESIAVPQVLLFERKSTVMKSSLRWAFGVSLVSVTLWGVGCGDSAKPKTEKQAEHGHEGHDHEGHDHSHAHGIHGGHVVELGKEEYHAEWTHDESGKIVVYILDSAMKKDFPITAEKLTINTKVGEKVASYDLTAVNRTEGDKPTAFQFEVEDKALLGVLESLSKGVTAHLAVEIEGKSFNAEITHDHGHDH